MKIIKMTVGKFWDTVGIASMLSFMLGICITNLGDFPYDQPVEKENLIASILYTVFSLFFIYISWQLSRRRLIIFNTVLFTLALMFSVWYLVTVFSQSFLPDALIPLFSFLTMTLHSQFIGVYFLMRMIDPTLYATIVFIICFAFALLSWITLLSHFGYFLLFREAHPGKKHLSKVERLKAEIAEDKLTAAKKSLAEKSKEDTKK